MLFIYNPPRVCRIARSFALEAADKAEGLALRYKSGLFIPGLAESMGQTLQKYPGTSFSVSSLVFRNSSERFIQTVLVGLFSSSTGYLHALPTQDLRQ